jgi:type II secretory pathway pseudopilin PulG
VKPRAHSEAGFTMIEALIVLIVSSVIFAVLFQISSRASERSAQLGARAQALADATLDERLFRMVLDRLSPPLQREGDAPPDANLAGVANRIDGWASSDMAAACMGLEPYEQVSLVIRQGPQGGALLCVGGRGEFPLASWPSGAARFEYSADGRVWHERWPTPEAPSVLDFTEPQAADDPFAVEVRRMVIAPLVRFSMPAPGGRKVWVARAGATELQPLPRREFLFTTGRSDRDFEVVVP